jgi:hypothetical protein
VQAPQSKLRSDAGSSGIYKAHVDGHVDNNQSKYNGLHVDIMHMLTAAAAACTAHCACQLLLLLLLLLVLHNGMVT